MPELPEVETTRSGIEPYTLNQEIKEFIIHNEKLRWPVDQKLIGLLPGVRINSVDRRGKYILITTDLGVLMIHLGMSGNLKVLKQTTPLLKHDHVELLLGNGYVLRLNDPRRFGSVLWHDLKEGDIQTHKLLSKLAPEPLTEEFNSEYLYSKICNRKSAIKTVVMNSQIIVGAGNIYANEALFSSKINPQTLANKITKAQCDLLVSNIKQVLTRSIEQGGTTLKDFLKPDGKPGYFEQQLNVYGRDGQECICCGENIEKIIIGQRSTFFCPSCQPLKR